MIARTAIILILTSLSLGALFILYEYRAPNPSTIVNATGTTETQIFSPEKILHIDMHSEGTLYLTQQEGPPTVHVIADKAIMPFIEISIIDKTLKIDRINLDNTVFNTGWPLYYVVVPDIAALLASGTARIISQNSLHIDSLDVNTRGNATIELSINAKQLDIQSLGTSSIIVTGTAREQHIELHGATRFNGENLKTKISSINASGACIAQIWATDQLNGAISGSSTLYFGGEPHVHVQQTGAAVIKKNQSLTIPTANKQ